MFRQDFEFDRAGDCSRVSECELFSCNDSLQTTKSIVKRGGCRDNGIWGAHVGTLHDNAAAAGGG